MMKKQWSLGLTVGLALSSLLSLSACGGQVQLNNTAAAYPGQNPYAPVAQQAAAAYGSQSPLMAPAAQQTLAQQTLAPDSVSQLAAVQQAALNPGPQSTLSRQNAVAPRTSPVKTATRAKTTAPVASPAKATAASRTATRAQSTPAVPQLSTAQRLVNQALQRFNALQSFQFTVDAFEANNVKEPANLSFVMKALQGHSKIQVLKHSNSLYSGVKMAYQTGTGSISVRPGGMLGFVKIDTKINDERLLTPRGYQLDQIDPYAVTQRLLAGPEEPKVLGKTQLNGRNIAILEYTRSSFDNKITRELLGIDLEDQFMRLHEMYEGDKLVFSLKLSDIQLNAPLSAQDLEI